MKRTFALNVLFVAMAFAIFARLPAIAADQSACRCQNRPGLLCRGVRNLLIPCSRNERNHSTLSVGLPRQARVVSVVACMGNSSWAPGGQRCRSDLGSSNLKRCPVGRGECPIGWSRVSNYRTRIQNSTKIVSADFYNWRHDNHRKGAFFVYYSIGK